MRAQAGKATSLLGVKDVIRTETQFAYLLFRTQLFNSADLPAVNKIQAGYTAQPLSAFLKQPAPATAPAVSWPTIGDLPKGADMFPYVNFLFQFCPLNPSESDLLDAFRQDSRWAKSEVRPWRFLTRGTTIDQRWHRGLSC